MKKGRNRTRSCDPKVYMKLVLPKETKQDYGVRPHGGLKGVSNHYPLSRAALAMENPSEFLRDVKNVVFRQMEEERHRDASPQWVGKYNKGQNHTGEQPLMVQRFLSSNKQEQQDGVLPVAYKQHAGFRIQSDDTYDYHQGLGLHQYLTATEMPGQSEKLVDIKHGRPTRTSLLRARHRSKSAPGPEKPMLEIRRDLHFLQDQTLKREEKYKSVDVPEDLLPLTENGETVHQFLVGARYNSAYYRDSKCYNKVGLYVSRDNPQHCFLKPGVEQQSLTGHKSEAGNATAGAFSEVTASELDSLQSRVHSLHPPVSARQAWGTNSITNSAPSTTPSESHESITIPSKSEQEHKSRLIENSGVMQAKCLRVKSARHRQSSPRDSGSVISSCDSCVLCQEGAAVKKGIPVHFHGRNVMSVPSSRNWTRGVMRSCNTDQDQHSSDEGNFGKKKNVDLMLVQQYHLRILGTQINMKGEKNHAPRSKVHYTPRRSTGIHAKSAVPLSSYSGKNRNNNNRRETSQGLSARKGNAEDATSEVSSITRSASRISVHISTTGEGDEEQKDLSADEEAQMEPTPHSWDVMASSPRDVDANNNLLQEEVEVEEDDANQQVGEPLAGDEMIGTGATELVADESAKGAVSVQGGDDIDHEKEKETVRCDDDDEVQMEVKDDTRQTDGLVAGDPAGEVDENSGDDADHIDVVTDGQVGSDGQLFNGEDVHSKETKIHVENSS